MAGVKKLRLKRSKRPVLQRKAKTTKRRSRADRVLAQGVGKTVPKAFGSVKAVGLEGWDAFMPHHLPLPRSVGAYTVVRTTKLITSNDRVNIFGTFRNTQSASNNWTNICMIRSKDSALPINTTTGTPPGNAIRTGVPFPGVPVNGSTISVVPAALSVQIMNQNALQTTNGIVAGAVSMTQLDLRDRTETWAELGNEMISFLRPRLMSAGKLALRGVQADSFPLNMAECSEFAPIESVSDATVPLNSSLGINPVGWAPIVVINEGSTADPPLELTFLVTIEWRVRFDIGNPAVSSHSHHGVTSDRHWDNLIKNAQSKAHGMRDIADSVANGAQSMMKTAAMGYQLYNAYQAAQGAGAAAAIAM